MHARAFRARLIPDYMDKLVERETATRNPLVAAPALAVQFFLIPLAVVAITVTRVSRISLAAGRQPRRAGLPDRGAATADRDRRWPAAYELSRLMADPKVRADRTLGAGAGQGVRASQRRRSAGPPLSRAGDRPPRSAAARRDSRSRRDLTATALGSIAGRRRRAISAIWALGSSGDAAVVPTLQPLYAVAGRGHPQDGGLRARRAARATRSSRRCGPRCRTPTPDVRWNAAVALARHGNHEGVPVLRQMLDRAVRRADGQARRPAGRGSGSDRRRDDQRPARGGDAEGRRAASRRSTT